jgi:hypothetical protein
MTMPAEASSISESRPNPSSATEPATSAAIVATPASIVIQATLSQASSFARQTRRGTSTRGVRIDIDGVCTLMAAR